MAIDIDELLKDEEAEDVKASEPSADEKKEDEQESLKKENERLRKANKGLNEKLKAKEQPKEETATVDPQDKLATREGWFDEIETRIQAKVAPIHEANFRRATDRFIKAHPEYAASDRKDDLRLILEKAKSSGRVDEEDIFDDLGQAWASLNWKALSERQSKASESLKRAQSVTAKAAAASESSQTEDEFSEEERAGAERMGMTPERFRAANQLYEQNSVKDI